MSERIQVSIVYGAMVCSIVLINMLLRALQKGLYMPLLFHLILYGIVYFMFGFIGVIALFFVLMFYAVMSMPKF